MIRTTLPQPTGSLRLGLVHSPQVGRGALIINGLTGVPVGALIVGTRSDPNSARRLPARLYGSGKRGTR